MAIGWRNEHGAGSGRGLAAMIGVKVQVPATPAMPIEMLPSPSSQRATHLTIAKSIHDKGLLQPIVVRPISGGEYEIVAGERRWRAAQRAGIHDVPVLIRELNDAEALEIALIENIQRSDLIAEARAP
jgi:ParB family chromosome partitioning protein